MKDLAKYYIENICNNCIHNLDCNKKDYISFEERSIERQNTVFCSKYERKMLWNN